MTEENKGSWHDVSYSEQMLSESLWLRKRFAGQWHAFKKALLDRVLKPFHELLAYYS